MKKLILIFILLAASCGKNIQTGMTEKGINTGKTVTVEFTSRDHFCDLQKQLEETFRKGGLDAEFSIDGISYTRLSFEFNENRLKTANISFSEISGDFINFIEKKYPGIKPRTADLSVIIEYTVCTRLNYGDLRSYQYGTTAVTDLASLKVNYITPVSQNDGPVIILKISFNGSNLGRSELINLVRKEIISFENSSSYLFSYTIK